MFNCTWAVYSTLNFLAVPFKPVEQHTKIWLLKRQYLNFLLALMRQEFCVFLFSVVKVSYRISKNCIPIGYISGILGFKKLLQNLLDL